MDKFDICIAGAGVIGLAIAYQLSSSAEHKNKSIVLIERESSFGQITSSRNSEVIHAGIYYATNSLKALLCVTGKHLLYEHLDKYDIPFKKTGKLIVAQAGEEESLTKIRQKALENGVDDLSWIAADDLRSIEPEVKAAAALLSPSTGIVDSHTYMQNLLYLAESNGVTFVRHTQVDRVDAGSHGFTVDTHLTQGEDEEQYRFDCEQFINCAGLDAQTLANRIGGVNSEHIPLLHPCKGDYFAYSGKSPFRHLIYPIPETNHTGLGIHSTLDIGGQTRFGPDTNYIDAINYAIDGDKAAIFAQAIKRYFPGIDPTRLHPAYSGIRPKIVGPGEPAGDFQIQDQAIHGIPGLIQLFGMESPGLTASLAIGRHVSALMV